MPGICFYYGNQKFTSTDHASHIKLMLNRLVKTPSDSEMMFSDKNISGGVVYHGNNSSTGINIHHTQKYRLILFGSCWINDGSLKLAAPDEILNHLLCRGFDNCVSLNGNYSFVLYDYVNDSIHVETDMFGIYPIYYYKDTIGNLYISSEIKSLIPYVTCSVNLNSVSEFIFYGSLQSDETFINEINKIPAHHRLIFKGSSLKIVNLDLPVFQRNRPYSADLCAELKDAFDLSISRYAGDTADLSISLSGGLDSRIIASAANRLGYRLKGMCSGPPKSLECDIAQRFAHENDIPIKIHEVDGKNFTDWIYQAVWATEGRVPLGHAHYLDGLFSGCYFRMPQLHGLLGGEVVGGSYDKPNLTNRNRLDIERACLEMLQTKLYWPKGRIETTLSEVLLEKVSRVKVRVGNHIFDQIKFSGAYSDYLWFRFHFRGINLIASCLSNQIIPWTDPIFPFLDNTFFKICASVNSEEIFKKGLQIPWALNSYPEINTGPRVKDGVLIDLMDKDLLAYERGYYRLQRKNYLKYISCRLSMGRINFPVRETYPFYDQWYRKWSNIRSLVKNTLLDERTLDRGLWKREGLLELHNDLRIGRNVWNVLGNIFLIEIFMRQFIDNDNKSVDNILKESLYI